MFNFFPAYRRGGGKIIFISSDMKQVKIKIHLNWKTRNIVGTLYGGSMFSAVDPIYMVMFMKLLGKEYIVWDKSASIQFIRPVKKDIYAEFNISEKEIIDIKNELSSQKNLNKIFQVILKGKNGKEYARVKKELYFRKSYNYRF